MLGKKRKKGDNINIQLKSMYTVTITKLSNEKLYGILQETRVRRRHDHDHDLDLDQDHARSAKKRKMEDLVQSCHVLIRSLDRRTADAEM